jgi:hypothetical protein
MEYKASFDALTKVLTLGVFILFAFIGQKNVKALMDAQGDKTTILIHSGIILFLLATLVVSYLLSTQKYLIDNNELISNDQLVSEEFPLLTSKKYDLSKKVIWQERLELSATVDFLVTTENITTIHLAP